LLLLSLRRNGIAAGESAMSDDQIAVDSHISRAVNVPKTLPRHVLVATDQQDLIWSVFNTFNQVDEVRVTGCSSMIQARYVCSADPPQVVVVDMRLLCDDPLGLVNLANTSNPHTHIVALSDHPVFEVGARFGKARLTFLQKPVVAQDLELLLRLKLDEEPPLAHNIC
jgi:DNA-binding NtrC family response regulator